MWDYPWGMETFKFCLPLSQSSVIQKFLDGLLDLQSHILPWGMRFGCQPFEGGWWWLGNFKIFLLLNPKGASTPFLSRGHIDRCMI